MTSGTSGTKAVGQGRPAGEEQWWDKGLYIESLSRPITGPSSTGTRRRSCPSGRRPKRSLPLFDAWPPAALRLPSLAELERLSQPEEQA